jgi:hypothetical protein
MLFRKPSCRVDGHQCAARHRLRSRKGSLGQRADKNHLAITRVPSGTREWSCRHGTAHLLEGYLKLSLVSCSAQLFPAISEREKIRFHQINRKTGNRIKYCKLDAVTGKPISRHPSPANVCKQVERAGPQDELNRALKWQKQEQDASDREPSARRDRLPGHQDRASLGDCDRCDLFRGRPGRHVTIYLARCQRGICVLRVGALCRRNPWRPCLRRAPTYRWSAAAAAGQNAAAEPIENIGGAARRR